MFKLKEIIPVLLIAIMIITAIGLFASPCLPDKLPSHWNASGEVDGYSGKTFALLFYPALTLFVYVLMLVLPKIDPFRKNYKKFKKAYYFFRVVLVAFFFLLYFYTILASIGYKANIMYFIIPLISLMILGFGFLMPKIKRNYFVGVRTPWTLQSDKVWEETHKMAGKAFVVAGLLGFLSIFFGKLAFWIFIVVIVAASFVPLAYSYFLYRKLGLFKRDK